MGMDRVYGTNSVVLIQRNISGMTWEEGFPEAYKALEGAVSRPVKLAGG